VTLTISHLFAAALAYLALLFLLAYAAERGKLPAKLARHPLVVALSLGVYASSWTYYGSVGFAAHRGIAFLTIYLGPTLACLALPFLWLPVLRLARDHQLASIADLFAFRFHGRLTGAVVTIVSLVASVPYIAQQIRAVAESARVLCVDVSMRAIALGFCALLTLFTVLFGARHLSPRERHQGLAVAIAFESLVNLVALAAVGISALTLVFGGVSGLDAWLRAHPSALEAFYAPARDGGEWGSLLLLSFGAAFLLPRQYHVAFAEGTTDRALLTASFAFPLFLLLLNLAIPPILWAGLARVPDSPADLFVLALPRAMGSVPLALLAFLGGVSAASAMVIVTTISLAGMCLNYLVLPARLAVLHDNAYARLLWLRRALVAAIIFTGYGFYVAQERRGPLVEAGLVSFVAFAQLLPGLFALLFWKRATRAGMLAGLVAGTAAWLMTSVSPLLARSGILPHAIDTASLFGAELGTWTAPTLSSLSLNAALLGLVSLLTDQRPQEIEAAQLCTREALVPLPFRPARSRAELRERLARVLGELTADHEIRRAERELGLAEEALRPGELARAYDQLERNLSGLFGPVLARLVIDPGRRHEPEDEGSLADQLRFLDQRLRHESPLLRGTAAELDVLRRYLRAVLEALPIGVAALGPDGRLILCNRALQRLIGVDEVAGLPLASLPAPWGEALSAFANIESTEHDEIELGIKGRTRALRLHKTSPERANLPGAPGLVLVVEDLTERKELEVQLIHRDRLASIGRLAAGVAHEVGNPLTGIACLAQNLRSESDDQEAVHERAGLILEQTRRIDAIVHSLLDFSRADAPSASRAVSNARVGRVALRAVVDEAIALVQLDRASKQIRMENACPEEIVVLGDRQRLTQVLVNLLTNACDASTPRDHVLVIADTEQGLAELRVIDHGAGIPEGFEERIFEPFFTTKGPAEGTGLGLSLAYSIVREHGGELRVESEAGAGTTVIVRLPLVDSAGEDPLLAS